MLIARLYQFSLIGIVLYIVQPGSTLFSWHPTLMTFGFAVVIYESILLLNPKRGILNYFPLFFTSRLTREMKIDMHAVAQVSGVVLLIVAFTSVVMAKVATNLPHFASVHSGFGLIAGVLTGFQVAFGLGARFPRVITVEAKYVKVTHLFLGMVQYLMCSVAYITGIHTDYMTQRTTPFIQVLLSTLPMFAFVSSYADVLHKMFRMFLKPK